MNILSWLRGWRRKYRLLSSTQLNHLMRTWIHRGRAFERKRLESLIMLQTRECPDHKVPLFREIINGEEVFVCPFRDEHQVRRTEPLVERPLFNYLRQQHRGI